MINNKTKQIGVFNLFYPFEAVHKFLFESKLANKIYENSEYQIKYFIGSDWSIENSGFSFYGPNDLNIVYELKNIIKNDFIRENTYYITQLNGNKINMKLNAQFSLINNTCENTCIIEFRLNYEAGKDLEIFEQYIKLSKLKEIAKETISKIQFLLKQTYYDKNVPKMIINQSFIIKKNYKQSFDFYNNTNNIAKTLKTDKVWKITYEENNEKEKKKYRNYSIEINNNIIIYFKVVSFKEIKDEKIEIVYEKSGKNYAPALNNFIKLTFFQIDKKLSYFLYETHLPFNLNSSIYKTICYYLFYCNYQSRKYIENT